MKKSQLKKLIKEEISKIKMHENINNLVLSKEYMVDFKKDRDKMLKPIYNYFIENYEVEFDPYISNSNNEIVGEYKVGKKTRFFNIDWVLSKEENSRYFGKVKIISDRQGGWCLNDYKDLKKVIQILKIPQK